MNTAPRSVVLISEHVYESGRRAGFHWLADAYRAAEWNVTFATAGVSALSVLTSDFRIGLVKPSARNKLRTIAPNLRGYFWCPWFHPVNLRSAAANTIATGVFRAYARFSLGELEPVLQDADTVIIESGAALALVGRIREMAPKSFLVYRVSDDLRVLGGHPVLLEFERKALAHFDLISVPSDHMVPLFPDRAQVAIQYHGLEKALLDRVTASPYADPLNAVSVGTTLFDRQAIETFAVVCPEVNIHVFGRIAQPFPQPNVTTHGEKPFVDLIPYLQHASVGIAPYVYREGCAYLAHTSNKVMQYTYCGLPVLLPSYIPNNAAHICHYRPSDLESARAAMNRALALDRKTVEKSSMKTWLELQEAIERRSPWR